MDAFISRKRRRIADEGDEEGLRSALLPQTSIKNRQEAEEEEESTDVKLAILSSLHPVRSQNDLLEILLGCEGSVETALQILALAPASDTSPQKRKSSSIGLQSALPYLSSGANGKSSSKLLKPLTKKGRTLHLYTPADIAQHTPCSIIHNFLPADLANTLLREILPEATSYTSVPLKLFDTVVQSPHTACFYVSSEYDADRQRHEYLYNGSSLPDVREILPVMRQVSDLVHNAVNSEIQIRIQTHYPNQQKLKYQSPKEWRPNAAFVNCYDGGAQSVGYHSDQLTYLGPRAVIGSLSLGVAREFRVRRVVPKDDDDNEESNESTTTIPSTVPKSNAGDVSGQIAIHLPHNSLLVMHAEMQEEWKHSIAPAQSIDPHPIAGNKRINITYRWYRDEFHPKFTPKCRCGVPTVLKTVMRSKVNRGRYMWMCQVGGRPDPLSSRTEGEEDVEKVEDSGEKKTKLAGAGDVNGKVGKGKPQSGSRGCGFFEWAEFTDDGLPVWKHRKAAVDDKSAASIKKSGDIA